MAVISFKVELWTFCDIIPLKYIPNLNNRIKSQNDMTHVEMLKNSKATNIQKGIQGNHMTWNKRKTNWIMEGMLCRTSKYKQHTIMYRNDWNRIWNTRKGLMRQTEKWVPEVPNSTNEMEEGNGRTVWLKQMCCIKLIVPQFLLWHFFKTSRVLSRGLIWGLRLRKQDLCTLIPFCERSPKEIQNSHSESTHFAEV